ncbi:MAG TPA: FmdB family zinc ribbon protein [Nitrospiraceae bacterium]|jgi:putative FmdB family regulatory protein|nr:FmdB family zinc ribbon protein [Nitrospiraceae bacterium]
MPIYEYRCRRCRKHMSRLVLNPRTIEAVTCSSCQSADVERLLSRFASPKSEEARLESLADPSKLDGLDENDPQSMAKLMKKMGEEMGEDLGDDLEAAMEGESLSDSATDGSDID